METTFREYVLNYSHLGSLICCLFFNSLLCLCLYLEKQSQLQLYRNVLYIQCSADMLAGVLYYISSMRFIIYGGCYYIVFVNPYIEEEVFTVFGVEVPLKYFALSCYMYALCLGLLFVPLNFYFRYQQLC